MSKNGKFAQMLYDQMWNGFGPRYQKATITLDGCCVAVKFSKSKEGNKPLVVKSEPIAYDTQLSDGLKHDRQEGPGRDGQMRILKVEAPYACPFRRGVCGACTLNDMDCMDDDRFPADCPLRTEPVFVEKDDD